MATLELTHTPILNSSAQILVLPVNTAGILLDPVLMRTKNLFSDNYQRYYRACRDNSLKVGSCLLHKRTLTQVLVSAVMATNPIILLILSHLTTLITQRELVG